MILKISTPPHINSKQTTNSVMRDVVIALIPTTLIALLFFGLGALIVILTSVAGCVLTEYLITKYIVKTNTTTGDYSAIITGLLIAFNLPSNFPIWMNLLGCIFAIAIGKIAFGGLGKNIFNPALVGRVFLFISFPKFMSTWPKPQMGNFFNTDVQTGATVLRVLKDTDAQTSATQLGVIINDLPSYWQMFVGYMGGCIGEVSTLGLLIGFAYLLIRKVASCIIPFYMVGTVFIITSIFWIITGEIKYDPIIQILSGGLMLGALFMATDYVTSPMSNSGKIAFAIGCGVLTVIIRVFGPYPEGVSFAILIMNAFVPIIDKFFVPRVFGKGLKK